jgi:hypothetical protein
MRPDDNGWTVQDAGACSNNVPDTVNLDYQAKIMHPAYYEIAAVAVLIAQRKTTDTTAGYSTDPAEFLDSVLQPPDISRKVC